MWLYRSLTLIRSRSLLSKEERNITLQQSNVKISIIPFKLLHVIKTVLSDRRNGKSFNIFRLKCSITCYSIEISEVHCI